jgi:hypothetical protein
MAFSLKNVRIDGCKLGPPSPRDYRTVFKAQNIPSQVDLRPYCSRVEDQGALGSCTANAAVGALEYHLKRRQGRSVDLSRMFVYYNTRRVMGQVAVDSGAQIREAMAAVLAYGACPEEIWPYDPARFTAEPPPQAYSEALKYEGIQYARLAKGDGILHALAQGFPVVFGGSFPRCCYDELKDGWIMPLPTREQVEEKIRQGGGHAMLIVGYDKHDQMYLVRNSWGESWGRDGYCRMPFGVADLCSMDDEFWIVSELERFQAPAGFTLVRPEVDKRSSEASSPSDSSAQASGLAAKTASMRDEIRSKLESDISSAIKRVEGRFRQPAPPPGRQEAPTFKGVCWACGGTGQCQVCHGRGCGYCKGGVCGSCNGHGAT